MKQYFIFLLFQLVTTQLLFGQTLPSNPKAKKAYEKAAKELSIQNKPEAIKFLNLTIELEPSFAPAQQKLADIYRLDENYKEAIPYYNKVISLNPSLTTLTYFGLGESLLNEGKYEEALPYLRKYAENKLSTRGEQLTNKYIKDCDFSILNKKGNSVIIDKLSEKINTSDNEYFPKLTADSKKIIFTRKTDNQENFYESDYSNQDWSLSSKLKGAINSEIYNEGAHSISPDGKYLFFTGCNRPEGMGSCDIYVSRLEDGIWGEPHNLGAPLNTRGWESQPAISADGKTLFFVSNRPGGYGGYDIWKSELMKDGKWSEPTNLGNKINTAFDESSPFIHADNNTLYFASNGHPGFGNQDLYLSKKSESGEWSTPINLGAPINNHLDQTSIQISTDGNIGFYSTQIGTRQLDIYSFQLPQQLKPDAVAYITGKIKNKNSGNTISANILLNNINNNSEIYNDYSEESDGKFLITLPYGQTYSLHIQKEGYLFYSEQFDLENKELNNKEISREILLQPIESGKLIQLNNIYFDINKFDILSKSSVELEILNNFLKINPEINIEIAGHTDNTGNQILNQTLSENRAIAVKKHLIKQGILASRISTVGYGDLQPIADNNTTEGRQLNRRTEVKISN